MKGFDALSEEERLLILAFNNGILVAPDIGLPQREIGKAIQSLKRRGFITGQRPLRLTRKGKEVKRDLDV